MHSHIYRSNIGAHLKICRLHLGRKLSLPLRTQHSREGTHIRKVSEVIHHLKVQKESTVIETQELDLMVHSSYYLD